jgi:dTDP-4-amino-4,6-dideoxygalactose transaminase
MKIPFVDLHAQDLAIKFEIDAAIARVIRDSAFIGGEVVREFEDAFAIDYGVQHCVSVANGTDAIYIALKMLGLGPGDEVITTAHSWISTSEAISQTGAMPIFIDVDEFYTMDVEKIEAAITPRTKMILPVHLFGQSANMGQIMNIARKNNFYVLEDCAQAHYATWEGRRVGTFGDVATFSFYPGKNLGAYGDAGAILTGSAQLASKIRMYANHGAIKKHHHVMEGINSRLDGLQAAILQAKLPFIHQWTMQRQAVAKMYDEKLAKVLPKEAMPSRRTDSAHVFHLYVIQVDQREELAAYMLKRGIQTAIHYPIALPFMPAYSRFGLEASSFPVAKRNQERILSLPIYPELTEEMINQVADAIRDFRDDLPI